MGTCFEGNWDNPKTGIIPRALQDIFLGVREREAEASVVTVTCSFMELYQENLYDLLSGKIKEQSSCDIREARVGGGIEVSGLTEQTIDGEWIITLTKNMFNSKLFNLRRFEGGKVLNGRWGKSFSWSYCYE